VLKRGPLEAATHGSVLLKLAGVGDPRAGAGASFFGSSLTRHGRSDTGGAPLTVRISGTSGRVPVRAGRQRIDSPKTSSSPIATGLSIALVSVRDLLAADVITRRHPAAIKWDGSALINRPIPTRSPRGRTMRVVAGAARHRQSHDEDEERDGADVKAPACWFAPHGGALVEHSIDP
jgi:hypothetical protein